LLKTNIPTLEEYKANSVHITTATEMIQQQKEKQAREEFLVSLDDELK
jgi:hypothetical protein